MSYFISFTIIIAATLWIGIMVLFFATRLLSTVLPLIRSNKKRIERSGVIAEAVILEIEKTGLIINNRTEVRLHIQVQPEKGRNFVAEIKDFMSGVDLAVVRTGSIVKVKYNPDNFKDLILLKQWSYPYEDAATTRDFFYRN